MTFSWLCELVNKLRKLFAPHANVHASQFKPTERGALNVDFVKDYADLCGQRLGEAGYQISSRDSREVIRSYLNIRHRRVREVRRLFHQGPYAIPAHLAAGHAALQTAVENGSDLWPYQSRKITKSAVEDGMLNDFGIQHFHLGTKPDTKHPQLISGTKELLFAVARDGYFYAIGIYDHSAWSTQALLDVVHVAWPDLFETFSVKNVNQLSQTYTDAEIASMRQSRLTAVTRRPDGKIQAPPGGGIGTDGSSLAVTRELIALIGYLEKYQELLRQDFEKAIQNGATGAGKQISLLWQDDRAFARCGDLEIDLLGNLPVPPLELSRNSAG